MPASSALLEIRGIAKSFPGVQALAGVDLEVARGEVHALVGENGAGKSTLGRVIAGVTRPDGGAMRLRGAAYAPSGKAEAQRLGVGMAMQESNLIETLTVAENIFLDRMPRRFGLIDRRAMEAAARSHLEAFGLAGIDPRRPVGSLGVGQRQLVEIAGAVARRGCELLILDEPSAALAGREVELLFARVRELRAGGAGVIYISHRLEEVRRLADRVTVLRDGRVVATRAAAGLGSAELIRLMVGRDADPPRRERAAAGEVALRVEGLRRGRAVRGVTFEMRSGEVLGLAGLMGSGRTETVRAIFGADRAEAGRVFLGGSREPARIRSPRDAVRQGLALLTEDRKEQGLLLPMSLRANITLARMRSVSRLRAWIRPRAEGSTCERFVRALSVRCRSPEQPVRELSGGNQQKVLLARWLHRDAEVLIFDEPTRGVDVAAKLEIHRLLLELAARGKAVLVVSSELEELMALCDRIAVLSAGRLVDTFERGAWSQDAILAAALSGYMRDARSQ
ncbi:MAG: sugar ABC transporter ATP-binding protein [Planctomycetes bacterium]|nr:sugar ABC transporter ATP-binding protein [Planctomycetota bacterium]